MFSVPAFTTQHPKSSRGFTLVELLVVITIIGILIALLLPAVQAAREAARRMQCSNNLKQTGLGLHMHLEQKGCFPEGHYWNPEWKTGKLGGDEATWITRMLPFVEQMSLHETIDWTKPFGQGVYQVQANRTPIPMFLCPSNDPVELVFSSLFARGTYAANNGIGPMEESTTDNLPPARTLGNVTNDVGLAGTFFMNSRLSPADITDGLSNTAFVSEIRAVPGDDMRGVLHYPEGPLYHHNYTPNSSMPDEIYPGACVSVSGAPCTGTSAPWPNRRVTMTARSTHPGGVNLLLGDGSITFVGDSVSLDVWHAVSTPRSIPEEITFAGF